MTYDNKSLVPAVSLIPTYCGHQSSDNIFLDWTRADGGASTAWRGGPDSSIRPSIHQGGGGQVLCGTAAAGSTVPPATTAHEQQLLPAAPVSCRSARKLEDRLEQQFSLALDGNGICLFRATDVPWTARANRKTGGTTRGVWLWNPRSVNIFRPFWLYVRTHARHCAEFIFRFARRTGSRSEICFFLSAIAQFKLPRWQNQASTGDHVVPVSLSSLEVIFETVRTHTGPHSPAMVRTISTNEGRISRCVGAHSIWPLPKFRPKVGSLFTIVDFQA